MKSLLIPAAMVAALVAAPVQAGTAGAGQYRLAEGPEAAGELVLTQDGRFHYALAVGALDERAAGRWVKSGANACLYTEPRPLAPVFEKVPAGTGEDAQATLRVTWPNGRGIAGIDFRIGFDTGEPVEGYTQEYGWTMRAGDSRVPRWIELSEPMHRLTSPRFTLEAQDRGRLRVVLVPNGLGVVDFQGACLEKRKGGVVLHRAEGDMRFVRLRR